MGQPIVKLGQPAADYHAAEGLNASFWKQFVMSCPKVAMAPPEPGVDLKETPDMLLGSLVHCMTLEPGRVWDQYAPLPKFDRRTKRGKIDYEAWLEGNADKTIVHGDTFRRAGQMQRALTEDNLVLTALSGDAQTELSIYWEEQNLPAKARLDLWRPDIQLVGDLKTAVDASPRGFGRACANFGYLIQAAWYLRAARAAFGVDAQFVFLVVEKTWPHVVQSYPVTTDQVKHFDGVIDSAIERYNECKISGNWPGYAQGLTPVELPPWGYI